MTDRELRDELVTLLVAGHETTATSLAWTFELLNRNPAVREKAEEADDAYLDALSKEVLRIRPVISGVGRVVRGEPFQLGDHVIPPGHGDQPVDRGHPPPPGPLPAGGASSAPSASSDGDAPDGYTWLPFGGGTRRCLGASFAMMEMRVVIRRVLERTELRPASASPRRACARASPSAPSTGRAWSAPPRQRRHGPGDHRRDRGAPAGHRRHLRDGGRGHARHLRPRGPAPGLVEECSRAPTRPPAHLLVALEGGEVVGFAKSGSFKDRGAYWTTREVSAYVHADHRGKGVGSALYTELLRRLDATEGLRLAVGGVAQPNPASNSAARGARVHRGRHLRGRGGEARPGRGACAGISGGCRGGGVLERRPRVTRLSRRPDRPRRPPRRPRSASSLVPSGHSPSADTGRGRPVVTTSAGPRSAPAGTSTECDGHVPADASCIRSSRPSPSISTGASSTLDPPGSSLLGPCAHCSGCAARRRVSRRHPARSGSRTLVVKAAKGGTCATPSGASSLLLQRPLHQRRRTRT